MCISINVLCLAHQFINNNDTILHTTIANNNNSNKKLFQDSHFPLVPLLVALACVVAAGSVAAAVVLARRRQGKTLPPGYMTVAGNGTSATYRNRNTVDPRYYHTHEDNTEV